MTISNTPRKAGPYAGNGSATTFAFAFKVFSAADVLVVRADTATGIETTLTLTTDYTVSLNADQDTSPGGTITTTTAPATGQTITLSSDMDYTQPVELTNNGGFYPRVINDALDRSTIQVQQLDERMGRTLTLPLSVSSAVDSALPLPVANAVIGWNSSGTSLQNVSPSTLATIVSSGTSNADTFSGDGVTTTFALSANPGALNNLDVSIDGVVQSPGADYLWAGGTTLTFTSAPPAGSGNILARYIQALPQDASQLAPFTPSGSGAVERTIQSKLHDLEINVEDYGAAGDGVTDDAAAIEAADAALGSGGTLVFGYGKTYLCASQVQIKNAGKIDLRGSTIKGSSAITSQIMYYGELKASYTSFTPFSVTANAISITIPAGVTMVAGDVVKLMSNTDRLTDYKHGMLATVVSVSGGVATLNTPFYAAFQVDAINVYRGYTKMEVCNGTFDLSAAPNVVQMVECLLVRGSNIYVHDCVFVGSQYAGVGVRADGDGAKIENCKAYGFLNTQGISGGGRVGYGFAFYGNNGVASNCLAYNCKHGFAAGARETVSYNVSYQSCQVYEDGTSGPGVYSGSYDMHANVIGVAEVVGCIAVAYGRALSIRCKDVTIRGGRFEQQVTGYPLLEGFEIPYENLTIDGIQYKLAASGSLLRIDSSSAAGVTGLANVIVRDCTAIGTAGRMIDISRATTTVTGLRITNNTHVGGSMFRSNGSCTGVYIDGNKATVTEEAVRFVPDGATYALIDIKVRGNVLQRNVGTFNGNIVYFASASATPVSTGFVTVADNDVVHSGDTGTGYSFNFLLINFTDLIFRGNKSSRGSFRSIAFTSCSVIRAIWTGQIIDGSWLLTNTVSASVLTDVLVHGNVGDTYTVSVTAPGVTKTRYVDADNNFVTYTP